MRKFLLVILDGAADSRHSAFAAAKKPQLDMLASNSACGMWSGPHAPHYNPRSLSSVATLEILGYSYHDEPGRGYLEALGAIKPKKNAVYLRGNFAYVKGSKMVDRRAGRDERGFDVFVRDINRKIKQINGVKIKVYRLFGHRIVVELLGKNLDKRVSDGDNGSVICNIKPLVPKAKKTAEVINEFMKQSSCLLAAHPVNRKRKVPANFILLRAAGSYRKTESFRKRYGMSACSISGVNIIRGISRYLGISVIDTPLSQLENDLAARAKKAVDALEKFDFVVLHINGADTLSHDKKFREKVKFIEKVDREVFSHVIKMRHINIAVISDHITDSSKGEHVFGHVPFLIYSPDEDIEGQAFDEKCRDFVADNPMKKLLSV